MILEVVKIGFCCKPRISGLAGAMTKIEKFVEVRGYDQKSRN
jgi:hypothetical protein